jgi:hypothetical protein
MDNVSMTVILTPVQYKAFQYIAMSPEQWIQNAATVRADQAIEEISKQEIQRMINDPNIKNIPADQETIIMNCSRPVLSQDPNVNNPPVSPS